MYLLYVFVCLSVFVFALLLCNANVKQTASALFGLHQNAPVASLLLILFCGFCPHHLPLVLSVVQRGV